jgi:predicted AAA+ superfamily ATPase
MPYIPRTLEKTLRRYLTIFSAVGITGPRQSGKSTMLRETLANEYDYVNFDYHDNVLLFTEDPRKFLREHGDRVMFDEVQRVPELFNYVKAAVDEDRRRKGKFILTGSSQFAFMKNVTESLAGRIGLLTLLPFEYREIPARLREQSIFRGAYPEIVVGSYHEFKEWYSSYIDTYLHRDVRDLSSIGELRDFRRCLQLLAARTSQILSMSEISRDIGVSVNTVKRWISILEASYIIFLLPPYHKNFGKRIVKSPKIYFHDTGLVSFLTGVRDKEIFERGPMYGPIFENYIISEIMKREVHAKADSELFYLRTSNGAEVDLLIDRKNEVEFVEIKSGETYRSEMTRAIVTFKKASEQGYLLYRGKTLPSLPDLQVMDFREFLGR